MILLAEHDEPSLAAKKKRQQVALETATSTPKNRVWNFFGSALGRPAVEPDLSWENATGSVQYSYETASGRANYYTRDHLGSVHELTNASGTVQTRYSYDPYGVPTLVSGSNLATKQYAGYYVHPTSGLYLTQYRAFDATTGRWLSRDPIAEGGGLNLYEYVGDNPIDNADPLGLILTRYIPTSTISVHQDNKIAYNVTHEGKCYRYTIFEHHEWLEQVYRIQQRDEGDISEISDNMSHVIDIASTVASWLGPEGEEVSKGFGDPLSFALSGISDATRPADWKTIGLTSDIISGTYKHTRTTTVEKLADCPCSKAGIGSDLDQDIGPTVKPPLQ